ncbi:MAG: ABC transporter ATP-binding protein [Rhodothermales bacterium]
MTDHIIGRDLDKVYEDKDSMPVHALRGVDIDIAPGEFTALAGPSGSGKTTLLNILSGLDKPTRGTVHIGDKEITAMSRHDLANFRLHNLGFVFQSYNLLPVLTAEENAEFTLLMRGVPDVERRRLVHEQLAALGIEPDMMRRRPSELSGGQQQRIAVARALVGQPKIVLADEPTANLDSETGARLLDLMKQMNEQTGITFLFSTHDPMVIERARRLILLKDGQIARDEHRD